MQEDIGDEGNGHPDKSVWGKKWNVRTVAEYIYKDEVQREYEKYIQDGRSALTAYQPALSHIFENLSEKEKENCEKKAEEWNSGVWPRDLQISCVHVQMCQPI